jgi:hypothetical protein
MTPALPRLGAAMLVAFLALAAAALPAASTAQDTARTRAPRPPSALFSSDTLLPLAIIADFRTLAGERDTLEPKEYPMTVAYQGTDGKRVAVPGEIETRGHFRLKRSTCTFPPLRLSFPDSARGGTLFARQRALKLVTHCRDGSYEQHVLREYIVYRIHNLVTPFSFRPRLVRARYVDARDTTRVTERYAFFIESERELAQRHGARVLEEAKGALFDHIDEESSAMLGLFEYFIGNTDWSLAHLHNVRIISSGAFTAAVPYDFDFSGLVDAPYSAPDPKLGIRSVRQRLYRGPCLTPSQLPPLLARFHEQRPAILALYDSLPDLDRAYARRAVRYLEDFFEETRDVGQFARKVKANCGAGT